MKLECLQENLAEGLTVVGRVVPTKSTLPVLSNVLLTTRDGELQLTANNLELSVAHRVPAAISREGDITLPARLLSDYVAQIGWMNPIYAQLRQAIAARMYRSEPERRLLAANLERARALPAGNGRYVIVNPPAARLYHRHLRYWQTVTPSTAS